jgi:hypothetical protein
LQSHCRLTAVIFTGLQMIVDELLLSKSCFEATRVPILSNTHGRG